MKTSRRFRDISRGRKSVLLALGAESWPKDLATRGTDMKRTVGGNALSPSAGQGSRLGDRAFQNEAAFPTPLRGGGGLDPSSPARQSGAMAPTLKLIPINERQFLTDILTREWATARTPQ
jgi:hypothetical protein